MSCLCCLKEVFYYSKFELVKKRHFLLYSVYRLLFVFCLFFVSCSGGSSSSTYEVECRNLIEIQLRNNNLVRDYLLQTDREIRKDQYNFSRVDQFLCYEEILDGIQDSLWAITDTLAVLKEKIDRLKPADWRQQVKAFWNRNEQVFDRIDIGPQHLPTDSLTKRAIAHAIGKSQGHFSDEYALALLQNYFLTKSCSLLEICRYKLIPGCDREVLFTRVFILPNAHHVKNGDTLSF